MNACEETILTRIAPGKDLVGRSFSLVLGSQFSHLPR